MNETALALLLCNLLNGGETEVRHEFPNLGADRSVRVDCETPTHIIEVGLDGTSSVRDSVHQAVFYSLVTSPGPDGAPKIPMVVIIDRDGLEDRWEYEMRLVTRNLGIAFARCKAGFIQAWGASAGLRKRPDGRWNDLPANAAARAHCDLGKAFDVPPAVGLSSVGLDKDGLLDEAPVQVDMSD